MQHRRSSRRLATLSLGVAMTLTMALAAACGGTSAAQVKQTSGLCGQTQAALNANPTLAALIKGAEKEGQVDWGNGLQPEEAQPVITAFHQAFPCVTVQHTRIADDDSRAALLREMEAGKYSYDVMDVSGTQIPDYEKAGVVKKVDWQKAFPKIQSVQLDPGSGALLSVGGSMKVVAYNTDKLKASQVPDTWQGFVNPALSGKFVVDSKPKFLYDLIPAWGEQKVLQYASQLASIKPKFARGQSQEVQLLASGDVSMLLGTYYDDVAGVIAKGAPVAVKFLSPVPDSLEQETVLAGAKDPNSAILLLGWLATAGNKYYDQITHRGLPLPGFDTIEAKLVQGRPVSAYTVTFANKEDQYAKDVAKALGQS
jgi:iron(III) transport system substrate-binding protein